MQIVFLLICFIGIVSIGCIFFGDIQHVPVLIVFLLSLVMVLNFMQEEKIRTDEGNAVKTLHHTSIVSNVEEKREELNHNLKKVKHKIEQIRNDLVQLPWCAVIGLISLLTFLVILINFFYYSYTEEKLDLQEELLQTLHSRLELDPVLQNKLRRQGIVVSNK